MTITSRAYNVERDFQKVSEFLLRTYNDKENNQNWLQARWEYMHYHPYFYNPDLKKAHNKIRIWEDGGKIVGVAHFELMLVDCYIEIDSDYSYLKEEIIEYAEENLKGEFQGKKLLAIYVNEHDKEFKEILNAKGFINEDKHNEYMSVFNISESFPQIFIPEGYKIKSLQEENDLYKVHRVLWRGFNHEGEPNEDLSGRELMQSAPNYRMDLNIVAVAPNGDYVSYCGLWYDIKNKIAYVEPVATDPDYRQKGLGRAVVLEGIRRSSKLGATKVYVATNKQFYLNIGFEVIYKMEAWLKYFE